MKNSNEVGRSKSLSDFTDEGQKLPGQGAMLLLVETGIITGALESLHQRG